MLFGFRSKRCAVFVASYRSGTDSLRVAKAIRGNQCWNTKGVWYEACASEGHCSFYFGRDRENSCKSFQLFQIDEGKIGEVDISGAGIIMTDAIVVYKSESFYGDTLKVEVAVFDCTRTGCDFIFRLSNRETGKEIARGKTGVVFFDYQNRKVVEVPKKFRDTCT